VSYKALLQTEQCAAAIATDGVSVVCPAGPLPLLDLEPVTVDAVQPAGADGSTGKPQSATATAAAAAAADVAEAAAQAETQGPAAESGLEVSEEAESTADLPPASAPLS